MRTRAWVGATLFVSAMATAPEALAQDPSGEQCPPRNGQTIVITAGDIDCVTASDYAAQYRPDGDKYQVIAPFTCYSGTAMTAPLLFQCVADTEDRAEFAVYPG
ncbi:MULTISPECIES: hypothetical protein [Mycolicibacterium]|uniref:Secreted protein n=2 Tax=Mycolicibacterium TaxID=1866885 RepID=A0A9X3BTY7_9MYCO|nr:MULTISPECIES: hypothetical protein [Mycolicibacterium]MCV7170148.1 hypothetical protein [[Mycobacterium] manitobense]MDO3639952.1 hypothetical protein [Mycolicibacterium arseniciresistens]